MPSLRQGVVPGLEDEGYTSEDKKFVHELRQDLNRRENHRRLCELLGLPEDASSGDVIETMRRQNALELKKLQQPEVVDELREARRRRLGQHLRSV